MFDKSSWVVGTTAVVYQRDDRGDDVYDVVIKSVGPKWVTALRYGIGFRFDHSGKGDSVVGWASRLWPSRELFDAEMARRSAWARLRRAVSGYLPPEDMSTDEIMRLLDAFDDEVEDT